MGWTWAELKKRKKGQGRIATFISILLNEGSPAFFSPVATGYKQEEMGKAQSTLGTDKNKITKEKNSTNTHKDKIEIKSTRGGEVNYSSRNGRLRTLILELRRAEISDNEAHDNSNDNNNKRKTQCP